MRTALMMVALALAAQAEAGGPQQDAGNAPVAIPGSHEVALSWPEVPGAKSYNVYYDTKLPVTKESHKVPVQGTSTSIGDLTNGTAYYFAVAAVHGYGHRESRLSAPGCAVPTAANTAGLTLYDALCGEVLDAQKWWQPGGYARRVVDEAAELTVHMVNLEPGSVRNSIPSSATGVRTASPLQRVTTLRADVTVPSATASRSGGADIRAALRLLYQPQAKRLNPPGNLGDMFVLEVGLLDAGHGLYTYRSIFHCDDPACESATTTGITFTDPAGLKPLEDGIPAGTRAEYDKTYTVEVSLHENEGTAGIFYWTIAGGHLKGGSIAGTADPSAYPGWPGLAVNGFLAAQMLVKTRDFSKTGGGSGDITARYDNVWVGFDNGDPALWDDFSGAGGNSGPTELSLAKWGAGGTESVGLVDGHLGILSQDTSTGAAATAARGVDLSDPSSVNTIQADVSIAGFVYTGGGTAAGNAFVQGRFYSANSSGAPFNALGDVFASVYIYAESNDARSKKAYYLIGRCVNPQCSGISGVSQQILNVTVGTGVHTLIVKWDPGTLKFTVGVDNNLLTVEPPPNCLPVAGPANAPLKRIWSASFLPAVAGTNVSMDVRVNNVFVAP